MGDTSKEKEGDGGFQIFSTNPDKAWTEKFYLFYSCIWPILFVGWAMSGYHLFVGDVGNNLVICLMGSPNIIIPYLYCPKDINKKSIFEYYWVKFNIWIGIFAFAASYFYSDYFFDILGMIYNFPHLKWNLNAILVGTTGQKVPIMMYTCCWFYFITYHILGNIIIRVMMGLLSSFVSSDILKKSIAVIIAAWLCAFGELYGTTMDVLYEQFHYKSMDWALKWGAWYYSLYFIVSFPMIFPMDEYKINCKKWTIEYTILNAFATSMIVFYLLDIFAQFVVLQ